MVKSYHTIYNFNTYIYRWQTTKHQVHIWLQLLNLPTYARWCKPFTNCIKYYYYIIVFILINISHISVKYAITAIKYIIAVLYGTQFYWQHPLPSQHHSHFRIPVTITHLSMILLITSLNHSKLYKIVLLGVYSNLIDSLEKAYWPNGEITLAPYKI